MTPGPMSEAPPPLSPDSTSSDQAGRAVDQAKARVFPCEQCGADLEFHIGLQSLECPYCAHVKQLEVEEGARVDEQDLRAALDKVADRRATGREQLGIQEVRCDDCGANVRFTGTLTSSECAYCGSPIQLEGVHEAVDRFPVDGVLPFLVENEQAAANLERWVRSRWFLPNDFKKRGVEGKFNGVYLPFWTYDALTVNRYTGERGEHYWVTVKSGDQQRRVRRTRWYPASGSFQRFFDDVLVVASAGLPTSVMRSLEPWPLDRCMPFKPEVMAGYFARTYDVELKHGFGEAKQRIEAEIDRDVRHRIGGDEQRVHSTDTSWGALTYKHLLLPVWLLAYRYRDKTYQIAVNAATGEVQGQRPYSWIKITLAVLSVLAVAGGVFFLANR